MKFRVFNLDTDSYEEDICFLSSDGEQIKDVNGQEINGIVERYLTTVNGIDIFENDFVEIDDRQIGGDLKWGKIYYKEYKESYLDPGFYLYDYDAFFHIGYNIKVINDSVKLEVKYIGLKGKDKKLLFNQEQLHRDIFLNPNQHIIPLKEIITWYDKSIDKVKYLLDIKHIKTC